MCRITAIAVESSAICPNCNAKPHPAMNAKASAVENYTKTEIYYNHNTISKYHNIHESSFMLCYDS